jgi:hypothetical protein
MYSLWDAESRECQDWEVPSLIFSYLCSTKVWWPLTQTSMAAFTGCFCYSNLFSNVNGSIKRRQITF